MGKKIKTGIEEKYYELIKAKLEGILKSRLAEKPVYLEITASMGFSPKLKQAVPNHREIIFSFLTKKPDITGFVSDKYSNDFLIAEVKQKITINDIYQTKMYKELFDAKYTFLISLQPIPEEIKRLCKNTFNILHSDQDSIYRFFVLGHFDSERNDFIDWFEENPFEKETYWK